jgi:hypothetical protein
MIEMIQNNNNIKDNRWMVYYASMMQNVYEKEIKDAIENVKRKAPVKGYGLRRRKRGYWTPAGFVWFSRKRNWRNYKKRASV